MKDKGAWERMGAASGLLACVSFITALGLFVSTGPSENPAFPSVSTAQAAPAYIAAHLNAYRIQLLLMTLGLLLFLWFLGTLWVVLKGSEEGPGRGSIAMVLGATAASGLMLTGLVLGLSSGLATSPAQAEVVPTLFTSGSLLFAIGGVTLSLFFFGAARTILGSGGLPRWLGVLAFVFAWLCVFAFPASISTSGLFDPATGLIGRWLWYLAFIVWVLLASVVLLKQGRRTASDDTVAKHSPSSSASPEGEGR